MNNIQKNKYDLLEDYADAIKSDTGFCIDCRLFDECFEKFKNNLCNDKDTLTKYLMKKYNL